MPKTHENLPSMAAAKPKKPKTGRSLKGWVNITLNGPDDGGDFGPNTKGTMTGGIQEGLDYAHANFRDVYIWGGRGGLDAKRLVAENVYHLKETLRIPWSQDFRMDSGNYVMNYERKTGPAVHIDSQMSCKYKFGLIVSESKDPVVSVRPENAGPDNFRAIVTSDFEFVAPVCMHPDGAGLVLDSSKGPVMHSRFFSTEINSYGIALQLTDHAGEGRWIANNWIHVAMGNQYHAVGDAIGIKLGEEGSDQIVHNRIDMSLHAPRGAYFDSETKTYKLPENFVPPRGSIGADIFGQKNELSLVFYGKREPGKDIVFEEGSRDNVVRAFNLPNGYTNKARVPNNRIITSWDVGFDVPTPPVPDSGRGVVNTTPYTIQAMIVSPGAVSQWSITEPGAASQAFPRNTTIADTVRGPQHPEKVQPSLDSRSQSFDSGFIVGQSITLQPGDRLLFTYSRPPSWRWRAVR
ncbi:MAG: hypothetical protein OK474_04000 [Thaumarchaeota archaeon]|nr:hypothetical protein [Nitrososphaerota archaeon]